VVKVTAPGAKHNTIIAYFCTDLNCEGRDPEQKKFERYIASSDTKL